MLDKINEMNFEDTISEENIYPLFKTNNPSFESEFHLIIQKYKTYNDFFSNYCHFSLTFLENFLIESNGKLNIFIELLTKNNFPDKNENEIYISIITNIILLNHLYLRLNSSLNNLYNQLTDYIHLSLKEVKNNETYFKLNEYLQLMKLSSNYNQRTDTIRLSRISTKQNTGSFRPQEFKNIITQKFPNEINEMLNNENNKNQNLNENNHLMIEIYNNTPKNDVDTPCFNKMGKKFNSPQQKRPKSRFLKEFTQDNKNENNELTPTVNNSSNNIVSFTSLIIDNNLNENDDNYFSKDKPLVSLLGVCNIMFKNNLINFNEKCQLKKLIIGKDKKILDIFDKCNEKESLFNQIKEYLKEFC